MNGIRTVFIGLLLLATGAAAQEAQEMTPEQQAMMAAFQASMTPGEPHARLARLTGDFTATVRSFEEPNGEPTESLSELTRSLELGGRVLREEWSGQVMGMAFQGVGRVGYDNVTERYWTTWTDNLSTGLFTGYGHWDPERNGLVFDGEMPDPVAGGMVRTRSVATYGDDGTERMVMYRIVDGEEVKIMEMDIRPR